MTLGELIELFRHQADDAEGRNFWKDHEIAAYLNEAVQEACERALLIEERVAVSLAPGQQHCALDPSVFAVKRVTCNGRLIGETSIEALDCSHASWEARAGQPHSFVFEQANAATPAQLRLVPVPHEAVALVVTACRGAKVPLTTADLDAEPEINARFHVRLLDWVLHRAFMKPDAEVFDAQRSATCLALFEQAFGQRVDANVQRKQRDRRPHLVRFRW